MSLQSIKFSSEPVKLSILNQLLVPYQTEYVDIDSVAPGNGCRFSSFEAIKGMYTRGAPAIMLVGCFSVVVELDRVVNQADAALLGYNFSSKELFTKRLLERIDELVRSRPTAVNLANGCAEIKKIVVQGKYTTFGELFDLIRAFAVRLYKEDLQANLDIGANGVDYVYKKLAEEGFEGDFSVMTICNTGSLATSGHGTALGIIRSLHERAKASQGEKFRMTHVYACETRPYNQGSRLTAYELKYEHIPFTLITDSMASLLLETLSGGEELAKSRGLADAAPVKFIVVGADRIVANGDLANKIGTFQLSLIASQYPGVRFIGAAPTTTIDSSIPTGARITIEQRPQRELTEIRGGLVSESGEFQLNSSGHVALARVKLSPQSIDAWNPSFDITSHKNIDCIVTEKEWMEKKGGEFHL